MYTVARSGLTTWSSREFAPKKEGSLRLDFQMISPLEECKTVNRIAMKNLSSELEAAVWLYSASQGGRTQPTPKDFLGCLFELDGEFYECRLLLGSVGSVPPGSRFQVPIKLLRADLLDGLLSLDKRFFIREGGQKIGEGKITKILTQQDARD
jgi:translation elongation factor EF-Tu-like GTPase